MGKSTKTQKKKPRTSVTSKSRRTVAKSRSRKEPKAAPSVDYTLEPMWDLDDVVVGLIEDDQDVIVVLPESYDSDFEVTELSLDSFLPCKSDEEVREALKSTLNCSRISVEVAGGILRHHNSW